MLLWSVVSAAQIPNLAVSFHPYYLPVLFWQLVTFHLQPLLTFVSWSTRENKTLDLFYAVVKDSYISKSRPPMGNPDHSLVFLCSEYKPLVQRQPVTKWSVRKWSQEAEETLQGCFETTNWIGLCQEHGQDINAMAECVTDWLEQGNASLITNPGSPVTEGTDRQENSIQLNKSFQGGTGNCWGVFRSNLKSRLETARTSTGRSWSWKWCHLLICWLGIHIGGGQLWFGEER